VETTKTFIDSQTLGGAVRALESGTPAAWSLWNTQSILTSTCVLISVPELRISPSARLHRGNLQAYAGTSGNHGIIGTELASAIEAYAPDSAVTASASATVRKWALRHSGQIANTYRELADEPEYQAWIDYEASLGWKTATLIINGVIDESFVAPVARILGLAEQEVRSVLLRSRNQEVVAAWMAPHYVGEDKELAKQMFTVGALLRGRYHDRVAECSGTNIIHHPIRDIILKPINSPDSQVYSSSNALEYLSKILIAASLVERSEEARIRLWCRNVVLVRDRLIHARTITVPHEDIADDAALKAAVRAAQDCEIHAHSTLLDRVVHHAVGLGAGAATSLLLDPWLFPVAYAATEAALNTVERSVVPALWSRSSARLSKLARSVPGRLRVIN